MPWPHFYPISKIVIFGDLAEIQAEIHLVAVVKRLLHWTLNYKFVLQVMRKPFFSSINKTKTGWCFYSSVHFTIWAYVWKVIFKVTLNHYPLTLNHYPLIKRCPAWVTTMASRFTFGTPRQFSPCATCLGCMCCIDTWQITAPSAGNKIYLITTVSTPK